MTSEAVWDSTGDSASCSSAFYFPSEGVVGTSGLVPVPSKTRGDSEFSVGGVSMAGVIGEGGHSWEIRLMRGIGLGLERCEVSSLDIEQGVVGMVDLMESEVLWLWGEDVSKFAKATWKQLTL